MAPMEKAQLKDRLKYALARRGIRQTDLANHCGFDKGQLSSWLSGKYRPRQHNIEKLAQALSVNEAWLMGYDAPMERLADNSRDSVSSSASGLLAESVPCLGGNQPLPPIISRCYGLLNTENRAKADKYIKNLYELQSIQTENEQLLNAAHERTDVSVTEEMKRQDNELMDSDEF